MIITVIKIGDGTENNPFRPDTNVPKLAGYIGNRERICY